MVKQKFLTKGIDLNVSLFLQDLMWSMIDSMEVQKQDYLQIFRLSGISLYGKTFQKIVHIQEQPEYKKELVIPISDDEVFNGKVFVIDDVTHCTMLLAEEY